MNQSDLLRKQLMPNENIRIRLNFDAVPTVRFDDEKITPKTVRVRRQLMRWFSLMVLIYGVLVYTKKSKITTININ